MDKVIKVVCSQTTANYRKPSAIDVQESYYLPPYSTVIGMIHKACNFNEYHDMKISIQGNYASNFTDMYTRYFFGIAYDATRHQHYTINAKGKKDGITRGLGYTDVLVDVKLILHIDCTKEEDSQIVYDSLKMPSSYLALGRHEDLLKIESVEFVETETSEELYLASDTYVPMDCYYKTIQAEENDKEGVILKLNKVYTVKKGIRKWDKVMVKYFCKGMVLASESGELIKEKNSDIGIFFA